MKTSTIIAIIILLATTLCFATVPGGESTRVAFTLDADDTTFLFKLPVNSSDDIEVYKRLISTGEETLLTITTDYTVAANGGDYAAGGTVTTTDTYGVLYQIIVVRNIKVSSLF